MSEVVSVLDIARHVIAGALIILGLVGLLASLMGQIRFPDFFTRVQAAAIGAAPAAVILAGLAVEAWDGRIAARLLLLAFLLILLAPIRAHLLASAAHAAGLAPLVGRQRGARR